MKFSAKRWPMKAAKLGLKQGPKRGLKHCSSLCLGAIATMLLSSQSSSLDYGVYDARSLAMGGTGVASATSQHALFYNPALLALYDGEEEDTRHGRVYLPMIVAQVNDAVTDALDVVDDDLDDQLSAAIDAFNASPGSESAAAVAGAGTNLLNGINLIGNRELEGEAFLGFMVSEPSNREGGSFYFGTRAIAGGVSNVTQDDIDLLQSYIDAMNSDNPLVEYPELFNEDGSLVDPADSITSSADIGSLVITEWGVSLAKEFEFWGQPVSFGVTPKIMHVEIFRDDLTYSDSDYNYEDDKRRRVTMNADLGIAVPLGDYFRVGLAAKDIVPQTYTGANNLSVETEARSRFAMAFVQKWVSVAIDVDLQKNQSLGAGLPGQELSAGIELSLIPWVHIRGGYTQDMEGLEDDVLSAGVGLRLGRFVADGAYAVSEGMQGGALQLGWTF